MRCTDMTKLTVAFHNFMNTPKNATDNAVLLWLTHITAKCGIPITFHDLLDIPPHTKEYNDI